MENLGQPEVTVNFDVNQDAPAATRAIAFAEPIKVSGRSPIIRFPKFGMFTETRHTTGEATRLELILLMQACQRRSIERKLSFSRRRDGEYQACKAFARLLRP